MKDFYKRLAKKVLIVKGHVPSQYGFSRQGKKIFYKQIGGEYLAGAASSGWLSRGREKKFPTGVVVWKRTISLSFLQGVSLFFCNTERYFRRQSIRFVAKGLKLSFSKLTEHMRKL